jgi:hypothetical protein
MVYSTVKITLMSFEKYIQCSKCTRINVQSDQKENTEQALEIVGHVVAE